MEDPRKNIKIIQCNFCFRKLSDEEAKVHYDSESRLVCGEWLKQLKGKEFGCAITLAIVGWLVAIALFVFSFLLLSFRVIHG